MGFDYVDIYPSRSLPQGLANSSQYFSTAKYHEIWLSDGALSERLRFAFSFQAEELATSTRKCTHVQCLNKWMITLMLRAQIKFAAKGHMDPFAAGMVLEAFASLQDLSHAVALFTQIEARGLCVGALGLSRLLCVLEHRLACDDRGDPKQIGNISRHDANRWIFRIFGMLARRSLRSVTVYMMARHLLADVGNSQQSLSFLRNAPLIHKSNYLFRSGLHSEQG